MFRMMFAGPIVALAALVALPASAITLGFDGVPEGDTNICGPGGNPGSVVEAGFTISNCPEHDYDTPSAIHLHDAVDDVPVLFTNFVTFTGPSPFDALSVTIQSLGTELYDDDPVSGEINLAFDNVLLTGYRGGAEVASQLFSTSLTEGTIHTVAFAPGFAALDSLRIKAILPDWAQLRAIYPDAQCNDIFCSHFDLLDISLAPAVDAPIPLPAPLLLLGGGLALLGGMRARLRP